VWLRADALLGAGKPFLKQVLQQENIPVDAFYKASEPLFAEFLKPLKSTSCPDLTVP
jgi:hypothetical protein